MALELGFETLNEPHHFQFILCLVLVVQDANFWHPVPAHTLVACSHTSPPGWIHNPLEL